MDEVCARYGRDAGEIGARYGRDIREIWARYGRGVGEVWAKCGQDLGEMLARYRRDVGDVSDVCYGRDIGQMRVKYASEVSGLGPNVSQTLLEQVGCIITARPPRSPGSEGVTAALRLPQSQRPEPKDSPPAREDAI